MGGSSCRWQRKWRAEDGTQRVCHNFMFVLQRSKRRIYVQSRREKTVVKNAKNRENGDLGPHVDFNEIAIFCR